MTNTSGGPPTPVTPDDLLLSLERLLARCSRYGKAFFNNEQDFNEFIDMQFAAKDALAALRHRSSLELSNSDSRAVFERWSIEQGWEISGPEARMRWTVWQGAVSKMRLSPDWEGLIRQFEAQIWHLESYAPHESLNADALGQIAAFTKAIALIRKHFTERKDSQ